MPLRRAAHTASALLLAGCLALAGCASPSRTPLAPTQPSASTHAAVGTPAASGSEPATTAAASAKPDAPRVAGTAPAEALPMDPPIETLPQPKPARTISGPRDLAVPVLMYHEIGNPPAGAGNPDLFVAPKEFAGHLRYLVDNGYHAVTLQQVYDFWQGKSTLPAKPVVISFDDGDGSQFDYAAPLLNEIHWPGTLSLIVGRKHLRLKPGIIRALIAAGWEIDSHSISHIELPTLSPAEVHTEVAGSRRRLQKLYGIPVNFFCYPFGRLDAAAIAEVKAAGYLGATTTEFGLARPGSMWTLRRVRVSRGQTGAELGDLIASAH